MERYDGSEVSVFDRYKTRRASTLYHAQRRAKQRYNLDLTVDELATIKLRKLKSRGEYIGHVGPLRSLWLYPIDEVYCTILYDEQYNHIVTFLERGKNLVYRPRKNRNLRSGTQYGDRRWKRKYKRN